MNRSKALLRRWEQLLRLWMPQRVVFHHVPKCGGTSVARALRMRYLLSQQGMPRPVVFDTLQALYGDSCDRHEIWKRVCRFREEQLYYQLLLGTRCIAAHVVFSDRVFEAFQGDCKFVTVLREPVSRFVSHYHHIREGEQLPALDEFLETPRARYLANRYVEYFCGSWERNIHAEESVERACKNIQRLHVVGFMDNMPGLAKELKTHLGVRVSIPFENRGHYDRRQIPDETLAHIRQLCAADSRVYQAALSRHRPTG